MKTMTPAIRKRGTLKATSWHRSPLICRVHILMSGGLITAFEVKEDHPAGKPLRRPGPLFQVSDLRVRINSVVSRGTDL